MPDTPRPADTTFRELTPAGRAAVSSVEVTGPLAAKIIRKWFRPRSKANAASLQLGEWDSHHGPAEELVVVRRAEDQFEIQCHGGSQAVRRILECLAESGCCPGVPQTSPNNIQEAVQMELQRAHTPLGVNVLVDQLGGQLDDEINDVVDLINHDKLADANSKLHQLLASSHYGEHIGKPFQVAIAGRPNAGKSSLLNRLAGYERAIVFDQPGTTRDALVLDTAISGWPVAFVDTAGLRATDNQIEREGVEIALQRMEEADLLIWVADATRPWSETAPNDTELTLNLQHLQMLVAHNKCDLKQREDSERPAGMPVSCLTGSGLSELKRAISERLTPEPPQPGDAVVFRTTWSRVISTSIAQLNGGNSKAAINYLTSESSWFRR